MTNFFDRDTRAIIDSNSPLNPTEGSPLQDEYMSASMRKWANENPKTTVGIGLVATALLALGGYKLSQSMRAAKSVWSPLAPAVDDLYSGLKGTAGPGSGFGFALPGPTTAKFSLTGPRSLGKTLLTPLNSGVDDGLLHGLKQERGIKDLLSVPGRNEAELVAALKKEAHGGSYMIQGLRTLENQNEMETLVSHYLRAHPEVGIRSLVMGKRYTPLETRGLWDRVLDARLH